MMRRLIIIIIIIVIIMLAIYLKPRLCTAPPAANSRLLNEQVLAIRNTCRYLYGFEFGLSRTRVRGRERETPTIHLSCVLAVSIWLSLAIVPLQAYLATRPPAERKAK